MFPMVEEVSAFYRKRNVTDMKKSVAASNRQFELFVKEMVGPDLQRMLKFKADNPECDDEELIDRINAYRELAERLFKMLHEYSQSRHKSS